MKKYTMNTEKTKDKAHDTNCNFVFPEEIVREVREHADNISEIYKRTVDILEYDFEGFYNYFIKILEQEYDYVILMSRRCLVFFQLFTYLYVYDKKEIKSKSVILSDKAIPYYFNFFKHTDRIAVVDDIIVHGRTVYSICRNFNTDLLERYCQLSNQLAKIKSNPLACINAVSRFIDADIATLYQNLNKSKTQGDPKSINEFFQKHANITIKVAESSRFKNVMNVYKIANNYHHNDDKS